MDEVEGRHPTLRSSRSHQPCRHLHITVGDVSEIIFRERNLNLLLERRVSGNKSYFCCCSKETMQEERFMTELLFDWLNCV